MSIQTHIGAATIRHDVACEVLFYIMAGVCLLTLFYPWKLHGRFSRIAAHFPLLLVPLVFTYENLISSNGDYLRFDLFILTPMLGFTFAFYVGKLIVWGIKWRRNQKRVKAPTSDSVLLP